MMEKITTGLKICPKCRHLMVIKEGKMTCPKCDREKLEEEFKTATKKVGEGIIRRPLKKKNTHKEEKSTNGEQSIEKILHSL